MVKLDKEFYQGIGRKGGLKKSPRKGFGSNPELARQWGLKRAQRSRERRLAQIEEENQT